MPVRNDVRLADEISGIPPVAIAALPNHRHGCVDRKPPGARPKRVVSAGRMKSRSREVLLTQSATVSTNAPDALVRRIERVMRLGFPGAPPTRHSAETDPVVVRKLRTVAGAAA